MAISPDVDERVRETANVETIEHRREGAVISEPAVDDRDLGGAIADGFVKNHLKLSR